MFCVFTRLNFAFAFSRLNPCDRQTQHPIVKEYVKEQLRENDPVAVMQQKDRDAASRASKVVRMLEHASVRYMVVLRWLGA